MLSADSQESGSVLAAMLLFPISVLQLYFLKKLLPLSFALHFLQGIRWHSQAFHPGQRIMPRQQLTSISLLSRCPALSIPRRLWSNLPSLLVFLSGSPGHSLLFPDLPISG